MQVDRSEAEGPDAQAQIARLVTQQGPQAEPTASALAEHDAAFPAIGQGLKADGIPKTVPRDSASVAATTGDFCFRMPFSLTVNRGCLADVHTGAESGGQHEPKHSSRHHCPAVGGKFLVGLKKFQAATQCLLLQVARACRGRQRSPPACRSS